MKNKNWMIFMVAFGIIFIMFLSEIQSATFGKNDIDPSALSSQEIDKINSHYTFFGHQSVGENILEGVSGLNSPYNQVLMNDFYVGENENPNSKINDFANKIKTKINKGTTINCALFKFCYVDFYDGSDVQTIFDNYKNTINTLKNNYPNIIFAHVTVPLTTKGDAADNLYRNRFNNLLRNYFGNDYILDLAEIESTASDGASCMSNYSGENVYALCDEYTDDGGHLNAKGSKRVAGAFVNMLAAIYTASGEKIYIEIVKPAQNTVARVGPGSVLDFEAIIHINESVSGDDATWKVIIQKKKKAGSQKKWKKIRKFSGVGTSIVFTWGGYTNKEKLLTKVKKYRFKVIAVLPNSKVKEKKKYKVTDSITIRKKMIFTNP